MSLAEALADTGTEVLLIDRNNALVQNAIKKVTWAVQCDATSATALESAGIAECGTVVVAIGSNMEASMPTTSASATVRLSSTSYHLLATSQMSV